MCSRCCVFVATENLLNRHHSCRVGEGVAAGGLGHVRAGNTGERGTLSRSGAGSMGDLERLLRRDRDDVGDGCVRSVEDFHDADLDRETEKLTTRSPTRIARISGFHPPAVSEILPTEPGRSGGRGCPESALNRTLKG
jgi:hypothetical protein